MPSERQVEAAARAMVVSDEQNGGPPWEYIMGLGKHAVEPLYERARAALSAAEGVKKEEGAKREWLVIEDTMKNAVFAPEGSETPKGYIPRDVAEKLLGRDLGGTVWFSKEDSRRMREHPEWRDTEPPDRPSRASLRALLAEAGEGMRPFLSSLRGHVDILNHFSIVVSRKDLESLRALHAKIEKALGGGTEK